jgi:hypothetical protein
MHVSWIFCEKQKCQHNWPMSVLISTSDMLATCNSMSTDCSSQTLALHFIVRTPCRFVIAVYNHGMVSPHSSLPTTDISVY